MNNAGDAGIALVNADAPDAVKPRGTCCHRCASSVRTRRPILRRQHHHDGGFASFDIYAFGTLLLQGRRCRSSAASNVSNALAGRQAPVGRQREGNRARTVGIPRGRAAV